jgi:hypothetical protein
MDDMDYSSKEYTIQQTGAKIIRMVLSVKTNPLKGKKIRLN